MRCRLNFPTEEEERQMLLGLTANLTGNEGRAKKQKKTTKRLAATAAAAKQKEAQRAAESSTGADHTSDAGRLDVPSTSPSLPKRQRRTVVVKAEQKVRIAFVWQFWLS